MCVSVSTYCFFSLLNFTLLTPFHQQRNPNSQGRPYYTYLFLWAIVQIAITFQMAILFIWIECIATKLLLVSEFTIGIFFYLNIYVFLSLSISLCVFVLFFVTIRLLISCKLSFYFVFFFTEMFFFFNF